MDKKLIIAVSCIVVALGVTLIFNNPFKSEASGYNPNEVITCKCMNQQCGKVVEMKRKDFNEEIQKSMEETGGMPPMGPMGMMPMTITCPECNKKSVVEAVKCAQCSEVFMQNFNARDGIIDRCPKCKYSAMEEEMGRE